LFIQAAALAAHVVTLCCLVNDFFITVICTFVKEFCFHSPSPRLTGLSVHTPVNANSLSISCAVAWSPAVLINALGQRTYTPLC